MTLALLAGLAMAGVVALAVGPVPIAWGEIPSRCWAALTGQTPAGPAATVLFSIRLPRVLLAVAAGAAMGLTGLAAQTLFRNPLASPYVMGISSGSAVGAVIGLLIAGNVVGFTLVPAFSAASGLAVAAAVFLLARRGARFGLSLLLAGIAVSAFCSALTAAALYLAGERLQTLVFWLMGGLWQATWRDVLLMVPVTATCGVGLGVLAPAMDVALVGERSARDLGVHMPRLQRWLLAVVALGTAVAVSLTGIIGFVGVVVPHLLRLAIGAGHRGLVPASAAGGALLLLAADTLARTVAAPAEVPVGILTALVGAPVFLWLLQRRGVGRPAA